MQNNSFESLDIRYNETCIHIYLQQIQSRLWQVRRASNWCNHHLFWTFKQNNASCICGLVFYKISTQVMAQNQQNQQVFSSSSSPEEDPDSPMAMSFWLISTILSNFLLNSGFSTPNTAGKILAVVRLVWDKGFSICEYRNYYYNYVGDHGIWVYPMTQ